jgi:hypothetical protein
MLLVPLPFGARHSLMVILTPPKNVRFELGDLEDLVYELGYL